MPAIESEPVTAEWIRAIHKRLEELVSQVGGIADRMESHGVEESVGKNLGSFARACKELERLVKGLAGGVNQQVDAKLRTVPTRSKTSPPGGNYHNVIVALSP